jgi:hypothetical protein
MALNWYLKQATYTPADVLRITGVAPGTQRQWWRRGFLGTRSEGRARTTLREVANILALRECSELTVGLETVAAVLPALSAGVVHHLALNAVPWPYCGPVGDKSEFRTWAEHRDMEGDDYIVAMLGFVGSEIARYVAITKKQSRALNDLATLHDDERETALVILDSWGIANRIRRTAVGDLFSAHSIKGPRCGCRMKDPSFG